MRNLNIKWAISACLVSLMLIYSCRTHYELARENYTLIKTNASVENGKNLVYTICGECHYNKAANKFIGNRMHDLPRSFGKLYAANLTNSAVYGVTKHYTNAQLAYLLKTGIKNDGRFTPYMVRPNMADDDINDIIAYLRSDDAAISAGDTSIGRTHVNALGRFAINTKKPQPYIADIKRPSADNAVASGRYLVDIIGCYHCHSKSITSINYLYPEKTKRYMLGGQKFKTPEGEKIHSPNLTNDKETGIGLYTKEAFRKAVQEGISAQGDTLESPMPLYEHLTNKQADDIYAYLQTLAPKHTKIKD